MTRRLPDRPRWVARREPCQLATADVLAADDIDTVRQFNVSDGLVIRARKVSLRRWQIFGSGVNVEALTGLRSVLCDEQGVNRW